MPIQRASAALNQERDCSQLVSYGARPISVNIHSSPATK